MKQMTRKDFENTRRRIFYKVNFDGVDFSGLSLYRCKFVNCSFNNANFSNCEIAGCTFITSLPARILAFYQTLRRKNIGTD